MNSSSHDRVATLNDFVANNVFTSSPKNSEGIQHNHFGDFHETMPGAMESPSAKTRRLEREQRNSATKKKKQRTVDDELPFIPDFNRFGEPLGATKKTNYYSGEEVGNKSNQYDIYEPTDEPTDEPPPLARKSSLSMIEDREREAGLVPIASKIMEESDDEEKDVMKQRNDNLFTKDDIPDSPEGRKKFLTSPLPPGRQMQCYIMRTKKGSLTKSAKLYELYIQQGEAFLLVGKKRSKNKTSNFMIGMDKKNLDKDGDSCLGKLRGNFFGTEFVFYDDGINPSKRKNTSRPIRKELGFICYGNNIFGVKGPRKMSLWLPTVIDGVASVWQSKTPEPSIVQSAKESKGEPLLHICNKQPEFNEATSSYVLNFSGRVTIASVKNFQLISSEQDKDSDDVQVDEILLQFGRISTDVFTLDLSYPFSPLQAFAVALTSLDHKLACE